MKYLKAFESIDDSVIDYIKDILIELKDVGVSYKIKTYGTSLFIRMTREEKQYKWFEVEPFIEHLISYLSDYGFKLNEEESSKDLLKSWDNRPFNYLEVRFDLVKEKEKTTWKNFFKKNKKKYTTLDLRNGNVYVKFSGKDFSQMLSLLKDAFPNDSYISSGIITKGVIYYAKSKFYYASTTKTSGLSKPVVSENDIELSTKKVNSWSDGIYD
jgi:ribosomal protein S8E